MKLRPGQFLLAPLALAPFAAAALGERALVPRVGAAMLRPMMQAAAAVMAITASRPAGAAPPARPAIDPPPRVFRPARPARAGTTPPRLESAPQVVVSRDRVLRLTADQLRAVGWATVVNERGRAAGVRLSGVGRLGLGLEDGDVVTSINGRPTPNEDEATAAGAAAWLAGAPAARADVARGNRTVAVTLELPARGRAGRTNL